MQKKGVSEVVSYVLLILIAVILAMLVFAYLKLYVPKEKPECKEGIDLMIEDFGCTIGLSDTLKDQINITLQNRGRFIVDNVYIRIGKQDRAFKEDVNTTLNTVNPHPLFTGTEEGLKPLFSSFMNLATPNYITSERADPSKKDYILEIQPAHYTKGKDIESIALCPPITQAITCKKIS